MKKPKRWAILSIAVVTATGGVPSVHPARLRNDGGDDGLTLYAATLSPIEYGTPVSGGASVALDPRQVGS